MAAKLPPLPVGVAPGSGYWNDWYEKLRKIINDLIGGVGHNTLAGLQGGQAGEYYHLTQTEHASIVAGLDSWTYMKLTSDQIVTTTSGVATALAFTPAANTLYEVEGQLWLQSSDIASGPQPGVAWNTGNSDGVAHITTTESGSTVAMVNLPTGTDAAALATSFPDTTNSYPAQVKASFKTGGSPSGAFTITLARS